MRQLIGAMTPTQIELEMEIQSLRVRINTLELRIAQLEARLPEVQSA